MTFLSPKLVKNSGLTEQDLLTIKEAADRFPQIEKLCLFGSRAMGTYEQGSDVDLVLRGNKVDWQLAAKFRRVLEEETNLPYFFDVVVYSELTNDTLRKHIDEEGLELRLEGEEVG